MNTMNKDPFRRRISYTTLPAVALVLAACATSPQKAPEATATPATTAPAEQWQGQVQPDEREIACSDGESRTQPGETKFAFTALDADNAPQVIGRLAVELDPAKPDQQALRSSWSFPPAQERRYSYGIENLPNVHTATGTYELSLSDSASGEPPQYEVHCSLRSESWPPPFTEPTF